MKHKESNMKQTHQTWIIAGTLLLTLLLSIAETTAQSQSDTQEAREQRIQWWREARFGMFIHWGLYAIPGGRTMPIRSCIAIRKIPEELSVVVSGKITTLDFKYKPELKINNDYCPINNLDSK